MLYDAKRWDVDYKLPTRAPWQLLLLKAAEVIEERGWAQEWMEDPQDRVCLLGALNIAAYGKVYSWWQAFWPSRARQRASRELRAYLQQNYCDSSIAVWNDSRFRNKQEVLDVLRKVAKGSL